MPTWQLAAPATHHLPGSRKADSYKANISPSTLPLLPERWVQLHPSRLPNPRVPHCLSQEKNHLRRVFQDRDIGTKYGVGVLLRATMLVLFWCPSLVFEEPVNREILVSTHPYSPYFRVTSVPSPVTEDEGIYPQSQQWVPEGREGEEKLFGFFPWSHQDVSSFPCLFLGGAGMNQIIDCLLDILTGSFLSFSFSFALFSYQILWQYVLCPEHISPLPGQQIALSTP